MTPPKPHRVLLDRMSGVADEASAYLRRRRISRKPFARVSAPGGRTTGLAADTAEGRALFSATAKLIEAARGPEPS